MVNLQIEVVEIQGECPVYKKGDRFFIVDGFRLHSKIELCLHSLSSIMPYYAALSRGVSARELGLGKDAAFVQCLDPCRFTNGGTVIFRITTELS